MNALNRTILASLSWWLVAAAALLFVAMGIDRALPWLERATAISPNYAQAIYSRAMVDTLSGRSGIAVRNAELAMELSPLDPLLYAMRACKALARIHPSKYGRLLDGVTAVHLKDVKPAPDQSVGLRLVAFGDRLYDRDIPVAVSGQPLSELFTEEMLRGGYRKKYLRAVSRLVALSR